MWQRWVSLSIAPEFALMLLAVAEAERSGPVFKLDGRLGRLRANEVSKIVSRIGKAAGVRVYVSPKDPEKVKYASAHDLRRAFGERWAARLMPAQLKELMRHESIETTLRFYVGTDAQRTAEAAWEAYERTVAAVFSGGFANSLANSDASGPPVPPAENRRKPKRRHVVIPSEAAGARTQDQRIKSPMLYRLSYSLGVNPTEAAHRSNGDGRRTAPAENESRRRTAANAGRNCRPTNRKNARERT
jgi:hypothetical protein